VALSKIQAESMNLADTYAFTGTVSGTPSTFEKVGSVTSTSSANSFNLDNVFSSSYLNYFITFKLSVDVSGMEPRIRFRPSTGGTETSSNYVSSMTRSDNTGTHANQYQNYADYLAICDTQISTDVRSAQGHIFLYAPYTTSYITMGQIAVGNVTTAGYRRNQVGGFEFDDPKSLTGIQFYSSANNFDNIDVHIWGIKE